MIQSLSKNTMICLKQVNTSISFIQVTENTETYLSFKNQPMGSCCTTNNTENPILPYIDSDPTLTVNYVPKISTRTISANIHTPTNILNNPTPTICSLKSWPICPHGTQCESFMRLKRYGTNEEDLKHCKTYEHPIIACNYGAKCRAFVRF